MQQYQEEEAHEKTAGEEIAIRLLGGFEVCIHGSPIPPEQWKTRKVRALVKLLALAAGYRMRRDEIIETLWPESGPGSGANAFYQALYNTRRIFERAQVASARGEESLRHEMPGHEALRHDMPQLLALKDGSLQLAPGWDVRVDVQEFESAAGAPRRADEPAAYQHTLSIYRGDLLPDDPYEDWAAARRESLRSIYLNLLLKLARLHEARSEYPGAIDALLRLLASDATHEEAHRDLMRLYALTGQRQKALNQYQALKDVLYRELEIEPARETAQVYQEIRAGRIAGSAPVAASESPLPARPTHNLPRQLTALIGREREIAWVKKMVGERPLVTLSGPGGVGKTRLALAAVEDFIPEQAPGLFPDGVWLVELAAISDPRRVVYSVAEVFGMREEPGRAIQESLLREIRSKRALLVVDNCEHLIEACADLFHQMLRVAPGLKILAASREPLGLPGEVLLPVESLPVPGPGAEADLSALARVEAVRLFVDRAQARLPGFTLTRRNAAAVAQICRLVDGIPLAVELAASRAAGLEAGQIAERLERTFRLLGGAERGVPERQRTLRATIDWSYNLLSEEEQRLLLRLSVFRGGWTLEAAEQVCAGDGLVEEDIANLLARLVQKSMVATTFTPDYWMGDPLPGYAMRYRLLKTIEQYAQEAIGAGILPWRDRHLDYYLRLAEAAEPKLHTGERINRVYQLHLEQDNLLSALAWALEQTPEQNGLAGARLAAALSDYWMFTWFFVGAESWLRRALTLLDRENPLHKLLRARCLYWLGTTLLCIEKPDLARSNFEESLQIYSELGDRLGIALATEEMGVTYWGIDFDKFWRMRETSLKILRAVGDKWHLADILYRFAGDQRQLAKDPAQCIALYEESIALYEETGDRFGNLFCELISLSWFSAQTGNLEKAREAHAKVVSIYQERRRRPFLISYPWHLGDTAYYLQAFSEMESYHQEGLRELDRWDPAMTSAPTRRPQNLRMLSVAALRQGKIQQAARALIEALELSRAREDEYGLRASLIVMTGIALAAGRVDEAARMFGAYQAAYASHLRPLSDIDRAEYGRILQVLPPEPGDAIQWSPQEALRVAQEMAEELARG